MKAAPAVKTHARVSCIQREKPVSEVIVLQFTREFGTGTLYLVYLYPRWFTRSLIFYLFIRTFEVHGFCGGNARGEEPMCVFFLRSRLPVAAIGPVSRLNLVPSFPIAHSHTHFMPSLMITVCSCLCVKLRLTLFAPHQVNTAMRTETTLDLTVLFGSFFALFLNKSLYFCQDTPGLPVSFIY